MEHILHRLTQATVNAELLQDMNVEDEYYSAIENRDTTIMEKDKLIALKDDEIAIKEGVIAEKDNKLRIAIKAMVASGMNLDAVSAAMQMTVDEIANAKLVLSGSLHGIIIAEAYGVPAILVKSLMDPQDTDLFKYRDWYYSAGGGRNFQIAQNVSSALELCPEPLPNLRAMQNKLIEAFPSDLWE